MKRQVEVSFVAHMMGRSDEALASSPCAVIISISGEADILPINAGYTITGDLPVITEINYTDKTTQVSTRQVAPAPISGRKPRWLAQWLQMMPQLP